MSYLKSWALDKIVKDEHPRKIREIAGWLNAQAKDKEKEQKKKGK